MKTASDGPGPGGVSPAVAALQQSLGEIAEATTGLRDDVRDAEAARRKTNRINLVLTCVLTLLVALVLAVGWQNNQLGQEVKRGNDVIADCTASTGRCYQESQRRTGSVITSLINASVYVSECARLYPGEVGPEYDRKLEACVAERIARQASTPRPAPQPSTSAPADHNQIAHPHTPDPLQGPGFCCPGRGS